MRTAPAVTVEVSPDPFWRASVLLLVGLGATSLLVWWFRCFVLVTRPEVESGWVAAIASAVACAAWLASRATWRLRDTPCRALRWTGRRWLVLDAQQAPTPVTLRVAIDAGGWMLLQAREIAAPTEPSADATPGATHLIAALPGRSRWIALSERRLPQTWHALRCAVHGPPDAPSIGGDLGALP
jgi:hypothetical protein